MTEAFLKACAFGAPTSVSASVLAGPAEDAAVGLWPAAYSSNDPEAVVGNHWPDAVLLDTASPVISIGTDAIGAYFAPPRGSGNKNEIGEEHTIVLDDNAAAVNGFYVFTLMKDGKPVPYPARFTVLVTRRGGEWRIAHHHPSPHVQPKEPAATKPTRPGRTRVAPPAADWPCQPDRD